MEINKKIKDIISIILTISIIVSFVYPIINWFINPNLTGMQIFLKNWYFYLNSFVSYLLILYLNIDDFKS